MKAEEARRITTEQLSGPAIRRFLLYLDSRIESAARKGERSICDPFTGPMVPNRPQREAILARLRSDGYAVKYHSNSDIRDPSEHSYYTVSW
jgi:hypothetical protein